MSSFHLKAFSYSYVYHGLYITHLKLQNSLYYIFADLLRFSFLSSSSYLRGVYFLIFVTAHFFLSLYHFHFFFLFICLSLCPSIRLSSCRCFMDMLSLFMAGTRIRVLAETPDPGLCISNKDRFLKFHGMNILDPI